MGAATRATVTVGILAAFATIVAAIISNYQNLKSPGGDNGFRQSLSDALTAAEQKAAAWMGAMKAGNVAELTSLSACPFFFDQKVLTSTAEVRSAYQEHVTQVLVWRQVEVKGMKAKTIGQAKEEGLLDGKDRILRNMRIEDDDVVVFVDISIGSRRGPFPLFCRRTETTVDIIGFWG